nr:hypothetical protein [Candidatus Woesearchaeota archaeon]
MRVINVTRKQSNIHLYDLNKLPAIVYAKLNKNEFKLFTKGTIKYLLSHDSRRAANSFNYLVSLTLGIEQDVEKKLNKQLHSLKREYLDDLIKYNTNGNSSLNRHADYRSKIQKLSEKFEEVYDQYF